MCAAVSRLLRVGRMCDASKEEAVAEAQSHCSAAPFAH